jgi:hypothetical protein
MILVNFICWPFAINNPRSLHSIRV